VAYLISTLHCRPTGESPVMGCSGADTIGNAVPIYIFVWERRPGVCILTTILTVITNAKAQRYLLHANRAVVGIFIWVGPVKGPSKFCVGPHEWCTYYTSALEIF